MVFIVAETARGLGPISSLAPLWLWPMSYLVVRFVTSDKYLARLIGFVVGGILGAAIGYALTDWATQLGFTVGAFFGIQLTGYQCAPTMPTRLPWALISTSILITCLGVFHHLNFYLHPSGDVFVYTALVLISAVLLASSLSLLKITHFRK